jgi:crossover junction endodeoxyribonuclease RuvC
MGWGIVEQTGSHLGFVASGLILTDPALPLSLRLRDLHESLAKVIDDHSPREAAVEETFVNRDPQSALKLGQARGIALVVPALAGLPVAEYAANLIKKTVTGSGHAEKTQIAMMVKMLLPRSDAESADAADALACAITHARYRGHKAMGGLAFNVIAAR